LFRRLKHSGDFDAHSLLFGSIKHMNTLNQILRAVLFFFLALFGMAMAFVFMVSTAIAVGILYIVARIKGRPFGVRAYWAERRKPATAKNLFKNQDVTDVEMREIH